MKTIKILAVAAMGVAMLSFSATAFANGKKGNGNSHGKGGVFNNGNNGNKHVVKGSVHVDHGFNKHHQKHHHHAHIVKYCYPVSVGVPITVAPVGSVMELPGYFGPHAGKVVLDVCGTVVYPKVLSWSPHCVVVEIPWMKIHEPVHAKLIVIGCDGTSYRPMLMKLVPSYGGPVAARAFGR